MIKYFKQFKHTPICLLVLQAAVILAQTTCNNGLGRVLYERLPNQQLQGFDDDVVRDTAPPFRVLEKCQDLCLRDRTASNNLVRACTSFDFQPGSRIASFSGSTEYEESTCYLTREQAAPEGIGNLMLVPNSVHFTEVCLTSSRPERECPSRRYVFERHPRKKLKLPLSDIKEITAANRTDCEDKCLNEFSFVCRSANYDSTMRTCTLSRFTRRTHPELLEDDPNSDYVENTCLNAERRCDGLVVFVKEENKRLGGPFEVDIFNNMTLEECQTMCLRAEKYFCRSVEFDDQTKQCILSEEDSISQKDDISISSSPTHHFYDLVCLDSQRGTEYPDNSVTSHLFSSGRRPDTAFQRYRNSRLGGEFHSEITGRSLSECLDECLRQTSFQCRSAVYSDRFRTCRLSRYNQRDGMRIIYDADYDYYENLMLNVVGAEGDGPGTRPEAPSAPGWRPGYPAPGPMMPDYDKYPAGPGGDRDRDRDRFPGYPADRFPPEHYPGDRMPGDRMPGDRMPGDRIPGDRMPGDRYPGYPGERYPDDRNRYPEKYPYPPGGDRYPPGRFPPDDRYPPGDRYPMGDRDRYPVDRYPPGPGDRYPPGPGDRYPPGPVDRYPPGPVDRYPPGPVDRYPPGAVDRYPPGAGDRYPYDRYPGYPGEDRDRYPMGGGRYPDRDRYPMGGGRYPPPPPDDRYPAEGYPSRPFPPDDRGRYPYYDIPGRYPAGPKYPEHPGSRYPSRYPMDPAYPAREYPRGPPPETRFPDGRYRPSSFTGRFPPHSQIDRYPLPAPPRYPPDSPRFPPDDIPGPPRIPAEPGRFPPPPPETDKRYPVPPPTSKYPATPNRFPVGTDRYPIDIYKYGNRDRFPSGPGYNDGPPPYYDLEYDDRYPDKSMPPRGPPPRGYPDFGTGYDRDYDGMYSRRHPPPPPQRYPYDRGYRPSGYDNSINAISGDGFGGYGPLRPHVTRCDDYGDNFKQVATHQKARPQYIRRSMVVPSIAECQRECLEARDFFCRSFNYKDTARTFEADRDMPNCELSDVSPREMDMRNPAMMESGNFDFYGRSSTGRAGDECLDVSQVCNEEGMEFTLRTPEGFNGRIYTYGFYDRCFFRGSGATVNVLRISGPHGYPECGTQRYGDTLTNIVVVQFSDHVQTGRDKRFNLTCVFRGPGEAVVTSGYIGAGSGSPIPIEYLPAENTMSSKVRLMILYQGRPTTTIAVGDPLTFRLEAQDGYNHATDIFATNVIARDPYSGRSIQLIDKYGCPVDPYVFPELDKLRDGDMLEARFNAFKIPESNFLVFEATVRTCRDGCQPAYCPGPSGRSDPSFGRKRRSLNDSEVLIDTESDVFNVTSEDDILLKKNVTDDSQPEGNNTATPEVPEHVREMIEVFDSREEMEQETFHARKQVAPIETVCLTPSEYHGLISACILLMILLLSITLVSGLAYRRYWKIMSKNRAADRQSPINSFIPSSVRAHEPFSERKVPGLKNSLFANGLQKTFATGNLSRMCQMPVMNPIRNSNNTSGFDDPSEPIYTDPSLFERSRSLRSVSVDQGNEA